MWGKKTKELEANKKYRLGSKESVCCPDNIVRTLHRVIALRDIPRYGVTAGQVGGYLEAELNLYQEGDSWVGADACVFGRVRIKDNALVTDNALVEGLSDSAAPNSWIGGYAQIKDNAQVSGEEFLISDNVQILDFANVEESELLGNVVVSGHGIVCDSYLVDSALVKDQAEVRNSTLRDTVVIKEEAYVVDSTVSGISVLGGNCRIENSKIRENTQISGRVKVKDNSVCEGTNVLSGDLVIPPNHYVVNKTITGNTTTFMGVLSPDSLAVDATDSISSPQQLAVSLAEHTAETEFVGLVTGIESEYKSYATDIVKLIKYPLMADPSVAETQEFLFLLRKAKRLFDSKDREAQQDIAEKLERAFMVAEAKALKVSSSIYSDEERKKTEDAKVFIAKACDAGSTIAEKKISFRSTMRALEGVVPLPEDAITAYREKVGLLEIEA
jgi:carbonic anhydrase/acetyltransferase-like protein (isoleucine patch superfamily)